ncbi:DUF3261 domain-containing protein [Gilliamella sp. wkB112]|uniref:DUF3261 domain-containing protein n=1 Tax=Gilliamella sp. wkB112 TaxID=3120257 RepID=UPI00080E8D70|nr:DUF3261 domain-containing protein [Gilliamella apicola]OCG02242.1 hypothetical protein A9G12_11065 [Gilliamella apicola]
MKKYLILTILMLGMLISACTTKPHAEAWLTKETRVNLPIPNLQQDYHDQQLLKFKYKNQANSLITLVDLNQNQLKVIGLTALGIRLFEIEYDGRNIKTKQNIFVKELPAPQQVLSDIMLSILPTQQWQVVLPEGWQLIDNQLHRKLLNDKQETIIDITYKEKPSLQIRKPIQIVHNIFGYQIDIQSMEAQ